MKKLLLGLLGIYTLSIVGCASVAGDNTRAVRVTSQPAGAEIRVDNQRFGTTPSVIHLPNYIYGGKAITVSKPGFKEQTLLVNTKFQPVGLFNILFWPGFVVDAATGDLVKIDPETRSLHTNLYRA